MQMGSTETMGTAAPWGSQVSLVSYRGRWCRHGPKESPRAFSAQLLDEGVRAGGMFFFPLDLLENLEHILRARKSSICLGCTLALGCCTPVHKELQLLKLKLRSERARRGNPWHSKATETKISLFKDPLPWLRCGSPLGWQDPARTASVLC